MSVGPRRQATIVGYAQSPIRRRSEVALGAITVETAKAAIADAGLAVEQIDGFTTGSLLPSAGVHGAVDGLTVVTSNWLAAHLGVNPSFASGFQGWGQLSGSVMLAVNAIAAGAAEYVLVHRALHNPAGRYHANPMSRAAGPAQWTAPQGYFGPLATIALPYNEYLQRYGAQREEMAAVVVEARRQGARIPWSHWHERPLEATEYLRAPQLAEPICRYDCDIPVDGAAAFVFTSAERAADLPHRPVHVAGYAQSSPTRPRLPGHWPLDDIMEGGFEIAERLWTSAGIGPEHIDLPQVYDGFSPFVWFWLEALGYCPLGEAHRFAAEGGIDADRGGLPVLSGGGALGNGRMHGVPQMLECYLQLSGRAGARQRDVAVGLACHSSPHLGGAVVYSAHPS